MAHPNASSIHNLSVLTIATALASIPRMPYHILQSPARTRTTTADRLYGHCFENAFAMLVAVPGFVAPYIQIP